MIQCSSPRYVYQGTGFTEKQAITCLWIAEGKTQREIAMIEGVTHQSIERRLNHVRHMTGASNTTEIITLLFAWGMIKAKEVQPSEPVLDDIPVFKKTEP